MNLTETLQKLGRKRLFGLIACVILPCVILVALMDSEWRTRGILALSVFAVILWTTEPAPTAYTSLLVLFLIVATGLLPFEEAWKAGSDASFWLIFNGMALSTAVGDTKLIKRLSAFVVYLAVPSAEYCTRTSSNLRLYTILSLFSTIVAIVIPSGVVRVIMLTPVAQEVSRMLSDKLSSKYLINSSAQAGILYATLFGTLFPGTGILTGSTPNIIILSILSSNGKVVYWGEWFAQMGLVFFVLQSLIVPFVVFVLVGRKPFAQDKASLLPPVSFSINEEEQSRQSGEGAQEGEGETSEISPLLSPSESENMSGVGIEVVVPVSQPPMEIKEVKVVVIVLLAVILWATDTLHKLPPVQVSLLAVLLAYFPYFGPTEFDKIKSINFQVLLYFTAILALGNGLSSDSSIIAFLENLMLEILALAGTSDILRYLLCILVVIPFNFLMEAAAATAVVGPVLIQLANKVALDQTLVGYCVAIGASIVFLPYQSAPYLIGFNLNAKSVHLSTYFMIMSSISLLSLITLAPLNILWWLR